jgi:hypothetical protein
MLVLKRRREQLIKEADQIQALRAIQIYIGSLIPLLDVDMKSAATRKSE